MRYLLKSRIRRDEAGQSMFVELIIVLIPLLLILFGILDFGFYVISRNIVANSAQAAVEQVASADSTASAQSVADTQLKNGGLTPSKASVLATIACNTGSANNYTAAEAHVIVTYHFTPLITILGLGNMFPTTLTSGATMPVSTMFAGQCG